jgi:hypothetical protein
MDSERTLAGQTVLVQGQRITGIGPVGSLTVPDGALRIDGSGKFLLPGLAEMHGHLPSREALEGLGQDYLDRILFLFVANGITTVRAMLGAPDHLQIKAEIAMGERLGPQLFVAGPSFNGNSVPTAGAAWRRVTEQRAAGFDLLKIHPGIKRPVYDQLVATAQREDIPFAGHVPADVGLERALLSGQASVEHLDGYLETLVTGDAPRDLEPFFFGFSLIDHIDESKIESIADATRAAGCWNTPTQTLFENRFVDQPPEETAKRPEMQYVPQSMVDQWIEATGRSLTEMEGYTPERGRRFLEVRRKLIAALRDAGAGILLGADTPQVFNVPGFATLQELGALVAAGLTPYEALAAGTRNPAIYFGLDESFGRVAVGQRADLLLLEANPLDDIQNIYRRAGVMLAGRWLSKEEIDQRLESLAAARSSD